MGLRVPGKYAQWAIGKTLSDGRVNELGFLLSSLARIPLFLVGLG
jgi:hypothetical protein